MSANMLKIANVMLVNQMRCYGTWTVKHVQPGVPKVRLFCTERFILGGLEMMFKIIPVQCTKWYDIA